MGKDKGKDEGKGFFALEDKTMICDRKLMISSTSVDKPYALNR